MKNKTITLVVSALMAALIYVATYFVQISMPTGTYNLGDCFVLIAGWSLPPVYAFGAAAVGSALSDVLSGSYISYAPATFIIKGLMALVASYGFKLLRKKFGDLLSLSISGIAAEILMILGYLSFETIFLYGFAASAVNVPFNGMQGVLGLILGILLVKIFRKNNILKR